MANRNLHKKFRDRLAAFAEKPDDCWLWPGKLRSDGYVRVYAGGGRRETRRIYAHRLAYELLVGPIPEGHELDHTCRVRHCLNPRHLEPVPKRENVIRGIGPTAENARKTHCIRGHELSGDNIYSFPAAQGRQCRECQHIRTAAYLSRHPERVRRIYRDSSRRRRERLRSA